MLPDGCIDFIARLDVGHRGKLVELTSLTVCGPMDRHRMVDLSPSVAWAGVRFRCGQAGPLPGVHPPEIFGRQVPALDCSPRYACLLDRIAACTTPMEVLPAMATFLTGQSPEGPACERAAKAVEMLGQDGARISQVASVLGVAERTLHRDIHRSVGLSPKSLARILRFQKAWARMQSAHLPDLCALALEAGYADQSHITREFQEFAGVPPRALDDSGPKTKL